MAHTIPRIVDHLLLATNTTRKDLELVLGLSRMALHHRMTGRTPFPFAEVIEMARYFDVPVSVFALDPTRVLEVLTSTEASDGTRWSLQPAHAAA